MTPDHLYIKDLFGHNIFGTFLIVLDRVLPLQAA